MESQMLWSHSDLHCENIIFSFFPAPLLVDDVSVTLYYFQ